MEALGDWKQANHGDVLPRMMQELTIDWSQQTNKKEEKKKAKKPGKSEYLRKNRKGNVLKIETLTERRDDVILIQPWTLGHCQSPYIRGHSMIEN